MERMDLSRREREKILRRAEILDVALRLFSQRGFHNVSMKEIAKEAEFGVGTLYKFFKSKEDLYKALVLEKAYEFHQKFLEVLNAKKDILEKIKEYIRVKWEIVKDNLDFIKLYLAEVRGLSFSIRAGLDKEIRKLYTETLEKLSYIFSLGIRKGLFKENLNPYDLAISFDGMINSLLLSYFEKGEILNFSSDFILEVFLKGVLK